MSFTVSYCAKCGVRVSSEGAGDALLHDFSNQFLCAPCHKRVSSATLPAVKIRVVLGDSAPSLNVGTRRWVCKRGPMANIWSAT